MKEKHLIGDVSKLLKVSTDTLRYYDKLGIVSPKKDPVNNYRYYTMEDLLALSYVMVFRYLEIPLDEIKHLIQNNKLSEFAELLAKQQTLIDQKIDKLLALRTKVSEFQEAIALAQSQLGQITLRYSPPIVFQPMTKEWDADYADYLADMEDHINIATPVFSSLIPPAFIDEHSSKIPFQYGLSGLVKDLLHLSELKNYDYIPSKLCIHTVITAPEHITPNSFESIMNYIQLHKLILCDDILARNIAFEHQNQSPIDYYELWIPVKNS
ncbi:MAG: MerR family transcriptional regulator [Cellulosilyticaceae bacterium]